LTEQLQVGSCGKPHGIRGEVAVFSEVPDVFVAGSRLQTERGEFTVTTARAHKGHLIVAFEEISDRNAAETLRNLPLRIDSDRRPELSEDEFWVSSLVGLQAQDRAGAQLGIVSGVVTNQTQDRLVVDTGHSLVEVPFVPELVPEVLETHIIVDAPEGLFDQPKAES
jgi:16S rRNA processing protein RimM